MKGRHLLALGAAMVALAIPAAADAETLGRPIGLGRGPGPVSTGQRIHIPSHSNHFSWEGKHRGFHGGFGGLWVVEREVPVVIERETVIREVPAAPPPPPPPPRKPYVIGRSYASLPQGCMKLIEGGASYYWCSGGEWYRQAGNGRYVAVAARM